MTDFLHRVRNIRTTYLGTPCTKKQTFTKKKFRKFWLEVRFIKERMLLQLWKSFTTLCRKHRTNDMLLEKIPRFTSHYECSQMSRSLILIYCWLCSFFWKNDLEHAFQKTSVWKLANLFKNKLIFFLENNTKRLSVS